MAPFCPSWHTHSYTEPKPTSYTGTCTCGNVSVTIRAPRSDLSDVGKLFKDLFPIQNEHTGDWQLVMCSCSCNSCTKTGGTLLHSSVFAPAEAGKETYTWHDPLHCCCLSCVRASGSLIWSNMLYQNEDVEWLGKETFVMHGKRGFCKTCDAYICFDIKHLDKTTFSVALLDEPSLYRVKPGDMPYIFLADQKGLRMPTAHGDGPDGGWAALAVDDQPKYELFSSGKRWQAR